MSIMGVGWRRRTIMTAKVINSKLRGERRENVVRKWGRITVRI